MHLQEPGSNSSPASRFSREELQEQAGELERLSLMPSLDALPVLVAVLNESRQILHTNQPLLDFLNLQSPEDVLGYRPGEALGCVYSSSGTDGCGSSSFCRFCGALRSIEQGLSQTKGLEQCSLLRQDSQGQAEALNFLVSASPLTDEPSPRFIIVSLVDTSDQQRRRMLERTFFHDILNTAGSLAKYLELLREEPVEDVREELDFLHSQSEKIVDDIKAHKTLLAAESNELEVRLDSVQTDVFLHQLAASMARYESAQGRELWVDPQARSLTLQTDGTLLRRVLENMLKNGLEATPQGGVVSAGVSSSDGEALFWVTNPGEMDEAAQHQVFKRSFSTKGRDRGIGTYSIKLLTERYLGGRVGFTTGKGQGTTFWVALPQR
jgi:signal transduction histidine kinase